MWAGPAFSIGASLRNALTSSMSSPVQLGPLSLQNPVLVSSGTFGYGPEFAAFFDLNRLGGLVTKTLTLEPRAGNPAPRVIETPAGMLNSVGLQNVGIDRFISEEWPKLQDLKCAVIVSIAGSTAAEFETLTRKLVPLKNLAALELNLSCPNTESARAGGRFAQDAEASAKVVRAVKAVAGKVPVFAKLTADVTDIVLIAKAVEAAGADAVTLINTLMGLVLDDKTGGPVLGGVTGGLSGPAIRPVAVRCVWEVRKASKIPIIGTGGIQTVQDARQFFHAGANAVSVGTANFWNPKAALQLIEGLEKAAR